MWITLKGFVDKLLISLIKFGDNVWISLTGGAGGQGGYMGYNVVIEYFMKKMNYILEKGAVWPIKTLRALNKG